MGGVTGLLEDESLVRETQAGNDAAFEELVRRHTFSVTKIVSRYARDELEVEDMAQETFIRAYFSLSRYRFQAPFRNWLARIASRVAIDHLRRRYRRRESFFSDLSPESSERLDALLAPAAGPGQTSRAKQKVLADLLEAVLGRLAPKEQLLIKAKELDGMSVKELSEMTGWSSSAVKVSLFRARKKMKKALEKLLREEGVSRAG